MKKFSKEKENKFVIKDSGKRKAPRDHLET